MYPLHILTINVGVMGKKLIEKMHNLKAKKRASVSEGTPKAKHGCPKLSLVLTCYPTLRDTEDDKITQQQNSELLIKEVRKERPRKEVVCSLGHQTYSSRHQNIIATSEETSISYILQQYPFLKKTYIVCWCH